MHDGNQNNKSFSGFSAEEINEKVKSNLRQVIPSLNLQNVSLAKKISGQRTKSFISRNGQSNASPAKIQKTNMNEAHRKSRNLSFISKDEFSILMEHHSNAPRRSVHDLAIYKRSRDLSRNRINSRSFKSLLRIPPPNQRTPTNLTRNQTVQHLRAVDQDYDSPENPAAPNKQAKRQVFFEDAQFIETKKTPKKDPSKDKLATRTPQQQQHPTDKMVRFSDNQMMDIEAANNEVQDRKASLKNGKAASQGSK